MKHGFTFRQAPDQIPEDRSLDIIRPKPAHPAFTLSTAAVWLSYLSPLVIILAGFDAHRELRIALFLILSMVWIFALPLRKRFGRAWARILYNLLPPLFYLGVQFAQNHINATVLLLGLWLAATSLSWSTLHERRDFVRQVAITKLCQRSVIMLTAVLIIPAFTVLHTELRRTSYELKMQEYAEQYEVAQFVDEASKNEIYDNAGEILRHFSTEEWTPDQPKGRLEALLGLALVDCAVLNTDVGGLNAVRSGKLPEDWVASFDQKEGIITISAALVNGTDPKAAAKALLCAVYHYYEWQMIEQMVALGPAADSEYYDLARSWRDCLDPDAPDRIGFLADDGTAAEKSAHAFAEEEIKLVMQYVQNWERNTKRRTDT